MTMVVVVVVMMIVVIMMIFVVIVTVVDVDHVSMIVSGPGSEAARRYRRGRRNHERCSERAWSHAKDMSKPWATMAICSVRQRGYGGVRLELESMLARRVSLRE
jgi:hypothetical protein